MSESPPSQTSLPLPAPTARPSSVTSGTSDLSTIENVVRTTNDSRDVITLRDERFERGDPLDDDLESGIEYPSLPYLPPASLPGLFMVIDDQPIEAPLREPEAERRRFSQWVRTSLELGESLPGRLANQLRRSVS